MGRPCRIGGLVITEIRERDDAVKEGNDGDAEKIDTRQADVMILVGDEGEFGRCGGLCALFGRGGFLRFKRRERAQGFFGNKAAVRGIEHINVQEHVQRGEEQDLNGRGGNVGVIEVQHIGNVQKMHRGCAREQEQEALFLCENVGEQQAQEHGEQITLVHFDAENVDREHQNGGAGENGVVALRFQQ